MSLDRQSIEKRDFPIGRRGYDPEAVDAHLARIANEVEELKLASHQRSENVAATASEQVRAILEAAEQGAAEIQRQAIDGAREVRAEAAADSESTRFHATAQARDYVGKVSSSTAAMLERLDAMQTEMATLFEALRTGSNRLNADIQLLEGNLIEVRGAVLPHEKVDEDEESSSDDAVLEPDGVADVDSSGGFPESDPEVTGEQGDARFEEAESADGEAGDIDGARLIALNMALDGTSREETARYLDEHFKLGDPKALLDEVYSSVQG